VLESLFEMLEAIQASASIRINAEEESKTYQQKLEQAKAEILSLRGQIQERDTAMQMLQVRLDEFKCGVQQFINATLTASN
jgi:predicted RNase H-like nuclease (RuvC/YqgF family)